MFICFQILLLYDLLQQGFLVAMIQTSVLGTTRSSKRK